MDGNTTKHNELMFFGVIWGQNCSELDFLAFKSHQITLF